MALVEPCHSRSTQRCLRTHRAWQRWSEHSHIHRSPASAPRHLRSRSSHSGTCRKRGKIATKRVPINEEKGVFLVYRTLSAHSLGPRLAAKVSYRSRSPRTRTRYRSTGQFSQNILVVDRPLRQWTKTNPHYQAVSLSRCCVPLSNGCPEPFLPQHLRQWFVTLFEHDAGQEEIERRAHGESVNMRGRRKIETTRLVPSPTPTNAERG